jgi:plasmid segregation protein ParM
MDERFIVRAIDVGYGHTKYTKGRDARGIICAHFPSLAPLASDRDISGGVMARRDTVVVEFGGARYEVGNDVELALGPAHNRVLDEQFATSERYMALVQGALHYIGESVIDVLVAGLPVELYRENRRALEERLVGEYEINGRKIRVRKSLVLPQPIGGYVSYASETAERWRQMQSQMNLVIDVGFCTVDWVTGLGTKTSDARSGSYPGGVAVVLRHVAQSIAKKLGKPFSDISMLDAALRRNGHVRLLARMWTCVRTWMLPNQPLLKRSKRSRRQSAVATTFRTLLSQVVARNCTVGRLSEPFPITPSKWVGSQRLPMPEGFISRVRNLLGSAHEYQACHSYQSGHRA